MKKLLILIFSIIFINCSTPIDRQNVVKELKNCIIVYRSDPFQCDVDELFILKDTIHYVFHVITVNINGYNITSQDLNISYDIFCHQ